MASGSQSKSPSPSKPLMGNQQTQTAGDMTFQGLGNLIKLLPTGTLFLYQFLSPVLDNYGHCQPINKYLTGALLIICASMCSFSCFTDSYTGSDGKIHYGLVTKDGLWPFSDLDAKSIDLSRHRLTLGDFAHAFLSVLVFAVVALLDPNIVGCYYPSLQSTQKTLLVVLPLTTGAIASTVFSVFPNTRHGIGYPPTKAAATGAATPTARGSQEP